MAASSGSCFINTSFTPPRRAWFSPAAVKAGLVPAGYVQEMVSDGSATLGLYPDYPQQFFVPYFSGGWPPGGNNTPQQLGQAPQQF